MGESFHIVQHLDPPFLFLDERVIYIPRGRLLDVNNRMLKIILFFEGAANLSINGEPVGEVEPGDVLVVPKPCRQNYQPSENREVRIHVMRILFDFNALGLNMLKGEGSLEEQYHIESNYAAFVRHHLTKIRQLKGFQDTYTHDCIRLIRKEIEAELPGYRYIVSAHCRLLVTHFIRNMAPSPAKQEPPSAIESSPGSWAVEHAKFFICENFNRHLSLSEIAWEVRLSAEHLALIFKQKTGQTVFEFLRDIRIESAKSYLISSKRGITEISELVGFSSPTLFCRNFKKATGSSPTDYRCKSLRKLSFQRTTLNEEEDSSSISLPGGEIRARPRIFI